MSEQGYPSDLSNAEWAVIQPLFPRKKRRGRTGRPKKHSTKSIVNAIFYFVRAGCQWRYLPKDFPPYKSVHGWFRRWTKNGLWGRINERLRRRVRIAAGRDPEPSAVIIDSQSVKTAEVSEEVGFDGGKEIKGRKRHILVDVLGLLAAVSVTAASVQDRDEAERMFEALEDLMPRLAKIWGDGGYTGALAGYLFDWFGWDLEIITPTNVVAHYLHTVETCFVPLPDTN